MGKNNWQVKSLGEVVKISKGKKLNSLVENKTPSSNRFIQIDDLRNSDGIKYTEDKSGVLVNKNDVLIAWDGANAGTVGFGLDGFIGSTIARLEILNDNISTNYFGWYLRTKSKYLRDNSTGATIPHINKSVLESLKIPLQPLPIQKQIAEILEKADQAKQKRKEANKLTDEFLQSVFIEMFGDPVKNPKGWPLEDVISNCSCIVPGRDKPKSFTGKIPWITTDDLVQLGTTRFSKKKLGLDTSEIKEVRARIIPKGSVLLTCVGDLGVISIAANDMVINQQLHSFQCSHILNNIFLMFCLSFQKSYMYKMATSTTVPYMNKSVCNSIPIVLPPIKLQQQFAEIVNKTESLKEKQKQSEQELENLFQSLMQKAFKGELM